MKTQNYAVKTAGLVAGLLFALAPLGAWAAGTTAGTDVVNAVTLDFNVGGTAQTQQTDSATFKVDNKMILAVSNADGADIITQPNATKVVLAFTVQNDGNATVDAILSAVNMATGTANPNGGTPATSDQTVATTGVFSDAACTTAITSLANLAVGTPQTVYVCSSIPAGATNDQVAVAGLLAKVGVAGSGVALATDDSAVDKNASTTTLATEYNIFAEAVTGTPATGDAAANDGAASDLGAYRIQAASLTLAKTVLVVSDPTGSTTPHAIPGATVEYTVTVANAAGGQAAASINIQDQLDNTNTTYVANSMMVSDNGAAAQACSDDGTTATASIGSSPASTATCVNSAGTGALQVSGFTVDAGKNVVITYQATIN